MNQKANLNDIHIVRVYDAPVKAVWDAWTDPNQLAKWWGPRGFTITTHSKDFRVGGHWKLTMHGPDGTNFPNYIKYIEVGTHSKLIYDHGGVEEQPPMFRVSVVFTESNAKTQMDMIMTLPTPEAAAETKKNIKKFDGYSTWDRLAEYLTHELTGKNQFVINRVFDAPLELMYEMWTNPKHFENWLPPTGATMEFIRADIRAGGNSFYCMSAPGDLKIYGRAQYIETKKPNRIVYTQQFVDKDERVSRHPFAPTWPETMLTTVTLADEGLGRCRVTVIWEPHGVATAEELQTFIAARAGMTGGWTGSFDKLDDYLRRQQ